jgi:hypothetical protein
MGVYVVRAFVQLRELLASNTALARKLNRHRQGMAPAHLAHGDPRLVRFHQTLPFLLFRKSSMFAFRRPLRSACGAPAAARCLSFSR